MVGIFQRLRERWLILLEGYTRTRLWITVAFALLVFFGATDTGKDWVRSLVFDRQLSQTGGALVLGVQSWLWGVAAFSILSFWWMLETALKFKKALTPAFSLEFNPNAEGIVNTRTEVYGRDGGSVVKLRDDQAVYIRITLKCLSETTIRGCAAFITKLEKGNIHGGQFCEIPLNGSISLSERPFDIYPRVQNVLDFLKVGENENKLEGATPWPFRLDGSLNEEATYKFTIEVIANDVAKSICVPIIWTKRWNAVTGLQASSP